MRVFLLMACLALCPSAGSADQVLSVADVMRDRVALDGKAVTVRGIFADGYQGPFLYLDYETASINSDEHLIRLRIDGFPLYRLYGRLERSLVLVTGRIHYDRHCDYRAKPMSEREIITVHCNVVDLKKLTRLKILDTIAADDPEIRHEVFRPGSTISLAQLPVEDPEYSEILELARKWRSAIVSRDVRALARLSDNPDEPLTEKKRLRMLTDPKGAYFNVLFYGRDSLRNRLRNNRVNPILIVFRRREGVHTFAAPGGGDSAYANLYICLCLRKDCSDAEAASLANAVGYNLADPYWCFDPYKRSDGRWVIWF